MKLSLKKLIASTGVATLLAGSISPVIASESQVQAEAEAEIQDNDFKGYITVVETVDDLETENLLGNIALHSANNRPPQYDGTATSTLTNQEANEYVDTLRNVSASTLMAAPSSYIPKIGPLIAAGFGLTGTISSNLANRIESKNNGNGVTLTYDKFGNITVESR